MGNEVGYKVHPDCGGRLVYRLLSKYRIGYRCERCGWEHQKKPKLTKGRLTQMGWKEKTAEKISFSDKGMVITGKIVSVGDAGRLEVKTYTMDTDDGLITFLGNTVLDKVLPDELGQLVRIEYLGDQKSSGGYNVKQFKVEVWSDDESEDEPVKPKKKVK